MVNRTRLLIIAGLSLVALLGLTNIAHADSQNVKDCLEENADCSEIDGSPSNESEENLTIDEDSGDTGSLVMVLIKTVIVLCLILALIYGLLKFLNKRHKLFSNVKVLENLGGVSVGQNKSIQIVRIGKRFYAIGVGDNIELLKEITDPDVKTELLRDDEATTGRLWPSFLQHNASGSGKIEPKRNFKQLFKQELDELKQNRKHVIKRYGEDDHG